MFKSFQEYVDKRLKLVSNNEPSRLNIEKTSEEEFESEV